MKDGSQFSTRATDNAADVRAATNNTALSTRFQQNGVWINSGSSPVGPPNSKHLMSRHFGGFRAFGARKRNQTQPLSSGWTSRRAV
jgi:hypothetical protein